MKIRRYFILIILSAFCYAVAFSQTRVYQIPLGVPTASEVDEENFIGISNIIYALFQPEIKELKRKVELNLYWETSYFSVWANHHQNIYSINFWGGLARVPSMTKIAWAFTVCHELGHIIAGAPYIDSPKLYWSSAEGQADHFAFNICLPRFLSLGLFKARIDDKVSRYCDEHNLYRSKFCKEILQAGIDFSKVTTFVSGVGESVEIYSPEAKTEISLLKGYPSAQCRLDIAVSASTCENKPCNRNDCWYDLSNEE